MPVFYTIECSKCQLRVERKEPMLPNNWIRVKVQNTNNTPETELDWCGPCWDKIRRTEPKLL